ncbi:hypothetical protein [Nocardia terpenica]|uniref:Uncharacterized protein n=1 Tax=Nocardia terpenica TaxID=455432 RepID=A0A161Z786_9NOCA|nr:hypothetical protein [Nocardia terpenica]ATL65938.1 hypothetical protein CRH09_06615 [Nocardia terpenica]KZM75984.1 hypothetical protein AWN90_16845 [Nocardia terpenica]MBF6061895.1 hypothetical protein [Nocardia terpenica]MBF6106304.1 hypothetical protein [Nocardia terpenica]MBF6110315.1 hypothetical protein [Nocardia terpenica]
MAGVEINDRFVRRTLDNGRVEEVLWQELSEVRIITTADGPFADDVFFVLIGARGNGCVVPHSAADTAFLMRLQQLPGFDHAKVIEAMGTVTDRQFLVWRRRN